jgi:S1-C subfamily serine protease
MASTAAKSMPNPIASMKLRIGDLTLTGQTFYSIPIPLPNSGIVGAVGYELMSQFVIKADNEHQQLTVYDPARFVYKGVGERLKLLPAEGGTALVVVDVFPRSPASKAHIKAGDRILLIDDNPPKPTWYCDDPAFLQSAGTVVTLTVEHDHSSQQIKLKLKDIL